MKKRIAPLLFAFVFAVLPYPSNLKAQNFNETVDYINELLKLHTFNIPSEGADYDQIRAFDQISIDAHGKIQSQRYVVTLKTGEVHEGQIGYGYLKVLNIFTKKDISETQYKLSMGCASGSNCVTYQFNNEGSVSKSSLNFMVDNYDVRERIEKALVHLLELAENKTTFYENDPFENPIKKDTPVSAGILTTNANSIPMINVGGVYEVPVILNGVLKLNFIFDAGASDVSVSPDVALTLIRTGTVADSDFLGTETFKFADGSTAKSKIFNLKEVQLGNKKVYNIRASISNSIKAPLLLGQSALNRFGKVTIDYNNSVIIFQN